MWTNTIGAEADFKTNFKLRTPQTGQKLPDNPVRIHSFSFYSEKATCLVWRLHQGPPPPPWHPSVFIFFWDGTGCFMRGPIVFCAAPTPTPAKISHWILCLSNGTTPGNRRELGHLQRNERGKILWRHKFPLSTLLRVQGCHPRNSWDKSCLEGMSPDNATSVSAQSLPGSIRIRKHL